MAENETSLRDDLSAAFDKVEQAAEPAPAPPEAPQDAVASSEPVGVKVGSDGKPRDEKGRYLSPEKVAIGGEEAKKAESPPKVEDGLAKPPVEAAPAEPTPTPEVEKPKFRAPASWKPTAREGWDKLPPDIQQEVMRREKEISSTLNETVEARQTYQKFKETVGPYEHMFRAEGIEPIQGIGNIIRTTAALATGPQQTKAQIIATLIKSYGVDIATLDALLAGQTPQQGVTQQAPPYDPRVDQLLRQIEQAKAQKETQLQRQAQEALSEIEAEEFFDDVREDMADLLEVAAKRGVAMSPKDAYNRAVMLHPEVSKVLEQRKAAATQGATQRAMAAASSVRAQPTAAPAGPVGDSIKDALESAWDRLSSKRT